jgi:phenylalanyl-tRNA synthetase beta chain
VTTDVAIESAIFDPVSIRRTAQRLGLRSEASSRFEKGQEHRLARIGADRTAELVHAWAGGEVAAGRVDTAPIEPDPHRVAFRPHRVNRLLGTTLDAQEQRELLARVGVETEPAGANTAVAVSLEPQPLSVAADAGEALTAVIPTWRRDLAIEADVAEEVARIHGYERIDSARPATEMPPYRSSPLAVRDLIRETLAGAGLTEVLTTALVSPRHIETFRLRRDVAAVAGEPTPGGDAVVVTNPLSGEHSLLRRNLLGSILDVVGGNLRHGTPDVAVFEVGKGYGRSGATTREWWRLGLGLVGAAEPPSWNRPRRSYDLDDAKGLVELLAHRLGMAAPAFVPESDEPIFHPGRTARTSVPGRLDALLGELHPDVVEAWDLRTQDRVILAELSIEGLEAAALAPERAPEVGRFPAVDRDLAVVAPESTMAGSVIEAVTRTAGPLLRDVRLFDVYRGAPLSGDEKSLAIRLRFAAADRTLTEAEVDQALMAVTAELARLGWNLRA